MIREGLFKFGPFILNAATKTIRNGEQNIPMPPKVFDTLLALVERRGEVVTKDQLMQALWPDSFVEESNLTQNVFVLRRALGRAPGDQEYIQTLPKRGYRISVPVEELDAPAGDLKSPAAAIERPKRSYLSRPAVIIAGIALGTIGLLTMILLRTQPIRPPLPNFSQLTRDGSDKRGLTGLLGGTNAPLATDGSRVYFTAGTASSMFIAEVSVAGGETAKIPLPFSSILLDFSRVRSELLVGEILDPATDTPLWAVPVPAGNPRRLGRLSARDAAWSRDGHRIAFTHANELYLADEFGGGQRKLADLPDLGWRPRWSPDGKYLRLTVADPKRLSQSIWEVPVDTGRVRPLLANWNNPSAECCGEWAADGRLFFFQATRGGRTEIWAIPSNRETFGSVLEGSDVPVQMTSGQMNSLTPMPSLDGKSLFVVGEQERGELARYDPASHQFAPYLGGISADFVDFSRDGQWISYVRLPEGTLWRSRIDGTDRLQLTFPPSEARVPQWSPDGRRIIFHTLGAGQHHQTGIVSREGGPPEIVPESTDTEMHPTWSPDGNQLLYSDYPFFGGSANQVAIHILDLSSHQITTLPGSRGFFGPTWSYDGRYVTALALDSQRVMMFDFHTQLWSEVAKGWGVTHWSSDSRYVYFLRNGTNPAIVRYSVHDKTIEDVASLAAVNQAGRLAGLQFGLTPDNLPVLLRSTGTEEIYAVHLQPRSFH
jgi:DNA-binding winged helix-turn-helix (wHTH) protein/Tol biopolymer transport system component